MAKIVKLYVNPTTPPMTIAKVIITALNNKKNVEIISMNSASVARTTEAMGLCQCSGKIEPTDSEKIKIIVNCTTV